MSLFKCKICGGDLEIAEGLTVAECEYCGTRQAVPKVMDENIQNLFNRANTLRIKSEFDKAEKLYEKIIQADGTQADAYWGLILCKYGIEYVDDPTTFKKVPTCHRASYDSVIADDDYKSALEHADMSQRAIYEEQAKEIDRIQREILALAQKEETYDVFICYKETDANGQRTQDSVIANDIYYQLTNEGFKVFYAAITLEGKLGSAYEPIIFAALNSAKVMLTIGTKPEHFNAVWVKNEWSRFLKIIKNDRSKLLIPCYRDMDAYELPEEFAHLQAQDMSKIGFINDVVRGIKKVITKDEPKTVVKETVITNTSAPANIAPLLERAFMFLEDGEWDSADEYCEKVLDQDPKNAEAYLGKLMAELHVKTRNALIDQAIPFDNKNNYQKAVRFGDEKLKSELDGYITAIKERNSEKTYTYANELMGQNTIENYELAIKLFDEIIDYKNSKELREKCTEANNRLILIREEQLREDKEKLRIAAEKRLRAEEERRKEKEESLLKAKIEQRKEFQKHQIRNCQTSISCGREHTVGLKSDGTVVAVGDNLDGKCNVSNWTDIVAISAGEHYTVGLKSDGTVVAAGLNRVNECNVSNWTDIVAISTSDCHTVGLRSNGTVVAVGAKVHGQCNVSNWTDIVAIAAGSFHTVGLKSDGAVVAAGDNGYGQCDVSNWTDIVAISAGYSYTVGLKSDGTVVAAGRSTSNKCNVSGWSDIVAIYASTSHTIGLKSNGTVVVAANDDFGPCNVSNWSDIVAISAGGRHTIGLKSDGTVVAIGYNNKEQCYLSGWSDIATPIIAETRNEFITIRQNRMKERQRNNAQYRAAGVCQHCGGAFKGLLSKTCTVCGKKKDY